MMRFNNTVVKLMSGIALGSLALHTGAANAQVTPQVEAPADVAVTDEGEQDIVVTGTQLRGIAPVGTNVVTLSRESIVASGATSGNDILTQVPQVTSAFGGTPMAPPGGLSIIRPNIRGLGASGTNTTLVIVDGHRVVGAGIGQATPDPDVIPPGAIERVDIVPDGGSSIYGSDAVGGVINYISRRKFDGVEINARTGFADAYQNTDVNVTVGKDWGSGSAYVSYSWAHNDAILGKDRDYVRQVTPNDGHCGAGTLVANGTRYAITGPNPDTYTAGTIAAPCDVTDEVSLWPRMTRHNVFASFSQDLGSTAKLDLRAYYADRRMTHSKGLEANAGTSTVIITPANPFFNSIAGETSQEIRTNYFGLYDDEYHNRLRSFGITPTLTLQMGGDWELRTLFNYGESRTGTDETQVNEDVAIATLNYYDLASNTPEQLRAASRHNFGENKQTLLNARVIADGALFQLPGGSVRVAVGAEYYRETINARSGMTAFGEEDSLEGGTGKRDVTALFGEIAIPVFGTDNARPGFHSLTLSASGRYDDYSDLGGTFNPKLGITYEPTDWIRVRGNWGKSFNAPALVELAGSAFAIPAGVAALGQTSPAALILVGSRGAETKPQTARTWSAGVDLTPVSGLAVSATYFNIHTMREISLLAGEPITPATQGFLTDGVPCVEAVTQYNSLPILTGIPPALACAFLFGGAPEIAVLDWRVQNLGEIKTDGIDFNINYNRKTGFGGVTAGINGTYTLNRRRSLVPGVPLTNTFDNPGGNRLSFVASLGAQVGDLSATASVIHRGGYPISPGVPANPANPFPQAQNEVDSFTTVDLFFQYKLPGSWLPSDTSLTLNVKNLFDQDPPFYNFPAFGGNSGYTNGSTLGRFIQVGLRTKF